MSVQERNPRHNSEAVPVRRARWRYDRRHHQVCSTTQTARAPTGSAAPPSRVRGEPKHCSMAAIPTIEDEDARRPSRERENLVKEATRLVNRMKANLARLGIRGFRPHLMQAGRQLETLRTPEGSVVPANTLSELQRDRVRPNESCRQARAPTFRFWS